MIQYLVPAIIISTVAFIMVANAAIIAVLCVINDHLKRIETQNQTIIWQNNQALIYTERGEKRVLAMAAERNQSREM
jgi:hypothetical protein